MSQGKISSKIVLENKDEYNRDLDSIKRNLTELRSELKVCQTQFSSSQNTAEALAKKEEILSKAYEEAKRKVQIYASAVADATAKKKEYEQQIAEEIAKNGENSQKLEELRGKLDAADNSIVQFTTYLNNATAEEISYNNQLQETRNYLEEAKNSTNGCANSIDEYGRKTKDAGESLEDINTKLDAIAKNVALQQLGEAAEKVVDTMKECARTAEEFEYSMAKVQSIAQVSGDELVGMSSDIRRVAADMGYSASEIAEATYQAISASVDASEAINFVENATQLARAGFTDSTMAVDVLTTALNAYGKEANTVEHIADDLITTQNLGKTTVDELAQSLGTVIPTASAYSVSLDQLSSAYVILTRNGINTANATTYLNGMMTELADDGSKVAEILYNKTGHSFGELMKEGYSLGDVMQILGDEVDGNAESFANLFSNVRAGRGALNIFNAGAEEYNKIVSTMQENTGATTKAFETMADTAEMTNQKFNASVENLQIAVGESLSPTIQKIKEAGIEMLEPITEFVEEHPALISAIAGAATAIATATAAVSALAVAVAVCKAVFGDFSGVTVLATAGAIAATGGILGLAAGLSKTAENSYALTESLYDNIEATRELNESSQSGEQYKKQADFAEALKKRIVELNGVENLSAAQKQELRGVVNQLNSMYGELNLQIDAQTGKLSENSEGWIENLEAQQKAEQAKYIQEQLSDIYEQQASNAYALWEAEEELKGIEEQRADIDAQLVELNREQSEGLADNTDKMAALYEQQAQLNEQEKELTLSKNELTGAQEELSGTYESLIGYMESELGVVEDSVDATNTLSEAVDESANSAKAMAEAEEAKENAIKAATEAIENQTGILDEWNEKSQATWEEMQGIWQSQSDGLDQYAEDLAVAKTYMDGDFDPSIKNLVSSMVELGDAATLHEFITGLQDAGTNIEELGNQWQEVLDKKSAAEDIYASILLQDQGYVEESSTLMTQYQADMELAQADHFATQDEAAEQHKLDMTTITTDTVNDMATAVTTQTEATLKPAVKNLATSTVNEAKSGLEITGTRSEAFYRIGSEGICGGLAQGIIDGTSAVTSAINAMVSAAAASVDISGAVAEIDKRLGAAVGG